MSAMQDLRLTDRVDELLRLQLKKVSTVESEVSNAISGIRRIVETTLNKSTASYGLRVLSEFGCTKSQLRALAEDFNRRGQEFAKTASHPYNHDFPYIDGFYMQNGIGFDQYKVDEQKKEQLNYPLNL